MFVRQPSYGYRFIVLTLVAISLFIGDYKYNYLAKAKNSGSYFSNLLFSMIDMPISAARNGWNFLSSHKYLIEQNESLNQLLLQHRAKLQELASLETENQQLRALMHAGELTKANYFIAAIKAVNTDPFMHRFVIDKGEKDAVKSGQAVIDGNGLIGMVTDVKPDSSYVLQISDSSAAVPVENLRNGLRSIIVGSGNIKKLYLQHITSTSDIMVGDTFVTSGIGGTLPAGYPVAVVTKLNFDTSKPFADIELIPIAKLEQSRLVLLVQLDKNQYDKTAK